MTELDNFTQQIEKNLRKEYAKNMLGFSKKRFLITLGISIVIWLSSGLVQALTNRGEYGSYVFGTGCELTGYPIASCVSNNDRTKFFLLVISNIVLWFWIIHFLGNLVKKRNT